MKRALGSIVVGILIFVLMSLYANSHLGPTPILLPVVLSVVFFALCLSSGYRLVFKRNEPEGKWGWIVIEIFVWICITFLNVKVFLEILYVT